MNHVGSEASFNAQRAAEITSVGQGTVLEETYVSDFVTTAYLKQGALKVRSMNALRDWAQRQKEGEYIIKIQRARAVRSVEANRYYCGVVLTLLSDHTGYTVEELHEWAKMKFMPKEVALCDGNGEVKDALVIGGTTTTLNTVQFYEYIEQIRLFAASELDVNIPDPDVDWRSTERAEPAEAHVSEA